MQDMSPYNIRYVLWTCDRFFGHVVYRMPHVHVQDMLLIEDLGCSRAVLPAHNRSTALPARYMGARLPIYQVYTNNKGCWQHYMALGPISV
jgi:hypothetical protein